MTRTYYSDYVRHCLRFYFRHLKPKFYSEADKKNWLACENALKTFSDKERDIFLYVYGEGDTIPDNVYQIAKANNIDQNSVWKLMSGLERKVAKRRGLL